MTKLRECLQLLVILFSIWYLLLTKKFAAEFVKENETLILYSPIIGIVLFGLISATMVLYRTFTFNDCKEAARELHEEIKEAREDLIKLGFKFKTDDD